MRRSRSPKESPSLSTAQQVKAVEEAGCDWIHVDVMVRAQSLLWLCTADGMPDVFVSGAASMQAAINVVLLLIHAGSHDAVLLNAVQDGQFVPNMCAHSPQSLTNLASISGQLSYTTSWRGDVDA